ncbi:MAG: hypothetical protein LBT64_01095 [Puniceicoccales bacterium]|nr:hypothetical protein [Puniceicoccales bacterium]
MRAIVGILCCAVAIGSSGCHSVGPGVIKHSHSRYGDAVVSSLDAQLLTNIVRLKYRDNPMFLDVGSITESRSFGIDGGLSKGKWFPHGKSSINEVDPFLSFKNLQAPTISYRPLRGKEFIKHMMTPIPLSVTLGLSSSGWKLQRVFNACIEKINDVENAPSASGPMPRNKPNYEKFYEMTDALKRLEDAGLIVIGIDPENSKNLVLRLKPSASKNVDVIEFKRLLGLDQNKSEFRFEGNFLKASANDIVVRTRSLMGILFYLSHAVDVPEEHVQKGLVQTTICADGSVFDWANNASGTLLKVHCASERPAGAFVATRYRGHWFYIDDDDLHSKSTFMFISTLFNLQAGEASAADVMPMLTIPVGA